MPRFQRDGFHIFYREQGEGPLLLILPGNTASSACHQGELEHFGRRYRAVSLDYRGTGRSDRVAFWPEDWWDQAAGDALELVRHLGEPGVLAVGSSGGAVVALKMAIRDSGAVRAVVADSCVGRFPPEWTEAIAESREKADPDQVAFWRYAHGEDWQGPVASDTDLMRRFGKEGGDWFGSDLRRIRCPVLFTAGTGDSALPDLGRELVRMVHEVPEGRGALIHGGDHPLMWTRPETFREVADGFLAEHG